MTLFVGAGGVSKAVNNLYVGVGGAWKQVTGLWVGVGGVWKQVLGGALTPIAAASSIGSETTGNTAAGGVQFETNGQITYSFTGSAQVGSASTTNWAPTGTNGALYWVRFTPTAGGALTVNTASGWSQLNAARLARRGPQNSGAATTTFIVEIATDSLGSNIVLTSTGWQAGYNHDL